MMKEVKGRDEDGIRILERLERLDGMRRGYYRDLSRCFLCSVWLRYEILCSRKMLAELC